MEQNQNGEMVVLEALDYTHRCHIFMALESCVYLKHSDELVALRSDTEEHAELLLKVYLAAKYREHLFWKGIDGLLDRR